MFSFLVNWIILYSLLLEKLYCIWKITHYHQLVWKFGSLIIRSQSPVSLKIFFHLEAGSLCIFLPLLSHLFLKRSNNLWQVITFLLWAGMICSVSGNFGHQIFCFYWIIYTLKIWSMEVLFLFPIPRRHLYLSIGEN